MCNVLPFSTPVCGKDEMSEENNNNNNNDNNNNNNNSNKTLSKYKVST